MLKRKKRAIVNNGSGAAIVIPSDPLYSLYAAAKAWVADSLDFNKNYDASVFETTIRVVRGLLSAFDLSGNKMFLEKATDIANRLLPAWNTSTSIPFNIINLASGNAHNPGWTRAVRQNRETLDQLKSINVEQERDVERVRQREELIAKVDLMKKKLPWLKYDMKKAEYIEAKENEKDAKKKFDELAKAMNEQQRPIE